MSELDLQVSIKKKKEKVTITYDKKDYNVALNGNYIKIYELDGIVSVILEQEYQKAKTRIKLSGGDTGLDTTKSGIIIK